MHKFPRTCAPAKAPPEDPTLHSIMQGSLEFVQRSINTREGGNPRIPEEQSSTTKASETISLSRLGIIPDSAELRHQRVVFPGQTVVSRSGNL